MKTIHVYWCRRDFRLTDNPALTAATRLASVEEGLFLPVFILEDYMAKAHTTFQFGYPQRVVLSKALPIFAEQFSEFVITKGKAADTLIKFNKLAVKQEYRVHIHVNEDVYPDFYKQVEKLNKHDVLLTVHPDQLTIDPQTRSGSENLYSVFTPFKKAVWKQFLTADVLPKADTDKAHYAPRKVLDMFSDVVKASEQEILKQFSTSRKFEVHGDSKHVLDIEELVRQTIDFSAWYFSEKAAQKVFKKYLQSKLDAYSEARDSLENDVTNPGTSKMSLALAWGFVSARWLRLQIQKHVDTDLIELNWLKIPSAVHGPVQYLSELIWREFYKYLLLHQPSLMQEEFQERFRFKVKWVSEAKAMERFRAWIKGETGYNIVDAAMMQLAQTGWMHNRSRMIVASVLTKNLGVDWRWGQEYFRAQLIDLDEASNNGGWQWGASVGADPKPIRIFNPYLQAKKYDASGAYQKQWIGQQRYNAGEPEPIVPHTEARADALKRYGLASKSPARDY